MLRSRYVWALLAVLVLAGPSSAALGTTLDLEGPLTDVLEGWTMTAIDPAAPPSGAVYLSNVPEYHWWNGCSPTAAGMLFGYWDTQLGASNLFTAHDGNAAYWDKVNMTMSNE